MLFEYEKGGDGDIDLRKSAPPAEATVVMGCRPCDASALALLDKLFEWDYDDVNMVLNRPIKDFFTTDQEIIAVMNMLKDGGNWRAELTIKSRMGIPLPVNIAASSVVDKTGTVKNIMISFMDVS